MTTVPLEPPRLSRPRHWEEAHQARSRRALQVSYKASLNDSVRRAYRTYAAHDRLPGPRRMSLIAELRTALERSEADWRTVGSLADELSVAPSVVRWTLGAMGDQVRRPLGAKPDELGRYRLRSRGYTRQEKWRVVRSYASGRPLRFRSGTH